MPLEIKYYSSSGKGAQLDNLIIMSLNVLAHQTGGLIACSDEKVHHYTIKVCFHMIIKACLQ